MFSTSRSWSGVLEYNGRFPGGREAADDATRVDEIFIHDYLGQIPVKDQMAGKPHETVVVLRFRQVERGPGQDARAGVSEPVDPRFRTRIVASVPVGEDAEVELPFIPAPFRTKTLPTRSSSTEGNGYLTDSPPFKMMTPSPARRRPQALQCSHLLTDTQGKREGFHRGGPVLEGISGAPGGRAQVLQTSKLGSKVQKIIGDTHETGGAILAGLFQTLWDRVKEVTSDPSKLLTALKEGFQDIAHALFDAVRAAATGIWTILSDILDALVDVLDAKWKIPRVSKFFSWIADQETTIFISSLATIHQRTPQPAWAS
ncbi:hypothetical protein QBC39DRAFT_143377 [Podospora conica]|nr:hypothetical protein QBC39DRAFT_143377 [Schizothecium conicum]